MDKSSNINIKTNEQKRIQVINEILQTEKTYVKYIEILINSFLNPIKELINNQSSSLTNNHINIIFSQILPIYEINSYFLSKLKERIECTENEIILGDIYLSVIDYFKLYSIYINNYDRSINKLKKLKKLKSKSKEIKELIFKLENESLLNNDNNGLKSIESYLIMPISRIPRYVLLLTDLIKYTNQDHIDYQNLNLSLLKMKQLTNYLNEKRNEYELMIKFIEIQKSLKGYDNLTLIKPTRKLLLINEFTVSIYDNNNNNELKSTKICKCFLFNDFLLITKVNGGNNLIYIDSFNLIDLNFKVIINGENLSFLSLDKSEIIVLNNPIIDDSIQQKWIETIKNYKK